MREPLTKKFFVWTMVAWWFAIVVILTVAFPPP